MSISTIVQVAIGIMFIWVALAMITSQTQDWIASIFRTRAKMLEGAIANLFNNNKQLKQKFYEHPLIHGLHTSNGTRKPAGIPEDKFALVLFDMVMAEGKDTDKSKSAFSQLKVGIEAMKKHSGDQEKIASSLETLLIGIDENSEGAFTEARKRVESWFNNSMERLSGSFRRNAQVTALIVGILISIMVNADTIAIANTLWKDPLIRESLVLQASLMEAPTQQGGDTPISQDTIEASVQELQELPIPIGWSEETKPTNTVGWLIKIVGIIISGVAAAQGAPYWFDLMKKLLNRDQGAAKK